MLPKPNIQRIVPLVQERYGWPLQTSPQNLWVIFNVYFWNFLFHKCYATSPQEKKPKPTILNNSLVEMKTNQIWQIMTNIIFFYGKGEGDK